MLVQCTKKFTAELNKALKAAGRPERGTVAAIIVNYPGSYYASPRALTTRDLHRAYKRSDGTAAGLFSRIMEEIEI